MFLIFSAKVFGMTNLSPQEAVDKIEDEYERLNTEARRKFNREQAQKRISTQPEEVEPNIETLF